MAATRLRVFAVIASSDVGGAERYLAATLKGLDQDRFEVSVVCHGRGPMVDEYSRYVARVWSLDLANVFDLRTVAHLSSLISEARPHVVHTHLWNADVLGGLAAWYARAPVSVATVYGAYHLPIGVTGARALRRRTLSRSYRVIYRCFDRVIAVSDYVRDDLIRRPGIGVDPRTIEVIRAGLDFGRIVSHVARRVPDRDAARPQTPARIINVANFFPIKGHEWLLRAMPLVLAKFPHSECVFVGDGPRRPALEALAADLGLAGHVRFVGTTLDPFELVSESDVFVLPSVSEALSCAILEALALGKPVIATRVGGTPEMMEDGRTGLLVPPRDPVALGNAIIRVLSDPLLGRRLGAAGQAVVRARFSSEGMAQQIEALYRRLVERAGGVNRYRASMK